MVLVSKQDADCKKYSWTNLNGYLSRSGPRNKGGPRPSVFLHRIVAARIFGVAALVGMQVDHINGDTLDNRRDNLRLVTQAQNQWNRGKTKNNTSGYKGVYFMGDKPRPKPWKAEITANNKRFYLGTFKTKEEAAEAYKIAAKKHHGEYART